MQQAKAAWNSEAMDVYLDSVQVSDSRKFTGFGQTLIEALEIFEIESALDVLHKLVPGRIKVPGIGPRRTGTLEDWVRRGVMPRFDPSKYPFSTSPRVQQIQRETLAKKSGFESVVAMSMERIPVVRVAFDQLHAERSAQVRQVVKQTE